MKKKPRFTGAPIGAPESQFGELGESMALPDSGWGLLNHVSDIEARLARQARAEVLQNQALQAAQHNDAAQACWYLCRSLGAARGLEVRGEPNLKLLFELIGALADLPAEICGGRLPPVVGTDSLGIAELCQRLALAREQTEEAWLDAELQMPPGKRVH